MKVVEIEKLHPTLDEVINIADQETVILRKSGGKMFVLSQVDKFDAEAELLKNNKEFMQFLKELSQEKSTISLGDFKHELEL